jgi:hypothetical protein
MGSRLPKAAPGTLGPRTCQIQEEDGTPRHTCREVGQVLVEREGASGVPGKAAHGAGR